MGGDDEIIELLFLREEEGILRMQQEYGARLLRLAGTILPEEDAKECVNDTYLSVWNSVPPNRPQNFFAYMAKICRNLAFNRLEWNKAKKRNAVVVELSEELADAVPDGRNGIEKEELGRLLGSFLKTLDPEKKQLFVKRYWYGNSIKELAWEYGHSENQVKSSLFRIRKKLRRYLEQEGIRV